MQPKLSQRTEELPLGFRVEGLSASESDKSTRSQGDLKRQRLRQLHAAKALPEGGRGRVRESGKSTRSQGGFMNRASLPGMKVT